MSSSRFLVAKGDFRPLAALVSPFAAAAAPAVAVAAAAAAAAAARGRSGGALAWSSSRPFPMVWGRSLRCHCRCIFLLACIPRSAWTSCRCSCGGSRCSYSLRLCFGRTAHPGFRSAGTSSAGFLANQAFDSVLVVLRSERLPVIGKGLHRLSHPPRPRRLQHLWGIGIKVLLDPLRHLLLHLWGCAWSTASPLLRMRWRHQ